MRLQGCKKKALENIMFNQFNYPEVVTLSEFTSDIGRYGDARTCGWLGERSEPSCYNIPTYQHPDRGALIKFLYTILFVVLNFFCVNYIFADDRIDIINGNIIDQNTQNEELRNSDDDGTKSNQEKLENVKKIVNNKNSKEEKALKDTSEDPINMYGIKMLKSLGIVIGALLIVLALVKRTMGIKDISSKEEKILILERKNLTPKAQLIIARVDSQKVLIGVSGDSINMMPLNDIRDGHDGKDFGDYLNFQIENGYSITNPIINEEKENNKKEVKKEGKQKK